MTDSSLDEPTRYEAVRGCLAYLLHRAGAEHWAGQVAQDSAWDAAALCSRHEGLTTFVLTPSAGGLAPDELPWANALLHRLMDLLAVAAAGPDAQGPEWHEPPLHGWRCLECGFSTVSPDEIDTWVAGFMVPAHVGGKAVFEGPALVDRVLSGDLIGTQSARGDARDRARASGITVAFREGEMHPCAACGSADTAACRWTPLGGGLHVTEDSLPLREPGHRHRFETSLAHLRSCLVEAGAKPVADGGPLYDLEAPPTKDGAALQEMVAETLRGLPGNLYLVCYEEVEEWARPGGWIPAGEHTWQIPPSEPSALLLSGPLETGVWQMYVADSAAPATVLPDLFKGGPASIPAPLEKLGITALIDAWHDGLEWRVYVSLSDA